MVRTTPARLLVCCAVSATVAAAALVGASPVVAATAPSLSSPSFADALAGTAQATKSGTYVFLTAPDPATTAVAGGTVTATVPAFAVAAGNVSAKYTLRWFSCRTKGAALATCNAAGSETVAAPAAERSFSTTASVVGAYLAAEVTAVQTAAGGRTSSIITTSDRSRDVLVLPAPATSSRPVWGVAKGAGSPSTLVVAGWTLPNGLVFQQRTVTVYSCAAATAGQVPTASFDTAGCTTLPAASVSGNANAQGASALTVATTTAMGGRFLLAASTIVAKDFGSGGAYAFTIRSAATLLPAVAGAGGGAGADAGAGAAAGGAVAGGDAANGAAAGAGAAGGSAADTGAAAGGAGGAAPAAQGTVAIRVAPTVARGRGFRVSVKVSGLPAGSSRSGRTVVQLRDASGAVKQRLTGISVRNGRGARTERASRRLSPGVYTLVVAYTDSRTHKQAAASRTVTVR